jgi:hypothetical protein
VHISNKKDLAGHPVPKASMEGKHSSIFEFRNVPNELKPYVHGESEPFAQGTGHRIPAFFSDLKNALHLRNNPSSSD